MIDLFTKLSNTPRVDMTQDEEIAIVVAARGGDNPAAVTLLANYLPLLKSLVSARLRSATAVSTRQVSSTFLDELRSAAVMGFFRALEEFDPAASRRFGAVLRPIVSRFLYEESGDNGLAVRVPSTMRDRYKQITQAATERGVDPLTITSEFGMSADYYTAVASAYSIGAASALDLEEAQYDSPELVRVETLATAKRALDVLDPTERVIIETLYGIGDAEAVSEREAAAALGMPRSTLQRTHKRALAKMLSHIS